MAKAKTKTKTKAKASARERGVTVTGYIAALTGWQKATAKALRAAIVKSAPEASESIKWGQPVYEANGPFCYFRAFSKAVNFGFWRGAELRDLDAALQSGGKQMAHLRFGEDDAVEPARVKRLVTQAIALNQKKGDPTRR